VDRVGIDKMSSSYLEGCVGESCDTCGNEKIVSLVGPRPLASLVNLAFDDKTLLFFLGFRARSLVGWGSNITIMITNANNWVIQ